MPVARQPVAWLSPAWTVGCLALLLSISSAISHEVPEPYMDEPFHVPMAQRYCRGELLAWDPKVTTFPGLYLLAAGYAWASRLALGWAGASLELTCSAPYLRSLNALLAVATLQVAYALSRELQARASSSSSSSSRPMSKAQRQQQHDAALGTALLVAALPTQLFFALLFYTDVPALLFLLLAELLLLRGRATAAAAAGAAATSMRQTNAVWVAFLTGAAMLDWVLQLQQARAPRRGSKARASQQGPARELLALLQLAWAQRAALLAQFWALLALPAAFAVFVLANGGITLGDKEAHAPRAHLMQPLYFAGFALACAGPVLLQPAVLRRLRSACVARPAATAAGCAAALAAACAVAARCSLAHPYLLADNRHYTFYLWRRLLARHWAAKFAAAPGYVAGWAALAAGLGAAQHWLWVAAYGACCAATLAPAWLIELRYFTPPLALALLHLPPPPRPAWLVTLASYVAVNAVALWVFAARPFVWADGSVARFMW